MTFKQQIQKALQGDRMPLREGIFTTAELLGFVNDPERPHLYVEGALDIPPITRDAFDQLIKRRQVVFETASEAKQRITVCDLGRFLLTRHLSLYGIPAAAAFEASSAFVAYLEDEHSRPKRERGDWLLAGAEWYDPKLEAYTPDEATARGERARLMRWAAVRGEGEFVLKCEGPVRLTMIRPRHFGLSTLLVNLRTVHSLALAFAIPVWAKKKAELEKGVTAEALEKAEARHWWKPVAYDANKKKR